MPSKRSTDIIVTVRVRPGALIWQVNVRDQRVRCEDWSYNVVARSGGAAERKALRFHRNAKVSRRPYVESIERLCTVDG